MESAIPEHLRSTRTRHRRVPDDYAPPYPSFVARHKPSVERVVMAYFGVNPNVRSKRSGEWACYIGFRRLLPKSPSSSPA